MFSINKAVICLSMLLSFNAYSQLTDLAANSAIFNRFEDPANVALAYGDMLFSNDGNDLF